MRRTGLTWSEGSKMSEILERPKDVPVRAAKPRRADGDLVQSLMRALSLMEILSEKGCRLTELSQRAKLPPSTTHRLLTTLEQKRFVRFNREESVWTVGSQCFAIGAGFLRRQDFMTEAVPRIEGLASRLGATVNLGVLENGNLLLVKQASNTPMSPAQPPGSALPLHATAMGKILLANSADTSQIGRYMSGGLPRLTDRTICEPSTFAKELQTIRQDGIAVDHEESMAGRRCIAAPLHNELGHCIAAISVTATRSQMTDTTVARLSALLSATAAEITRASGGYGGRPL
jgi:IclR family acetate operon transcriptional repressor